MAELVAIALMLVLAVAISAGQAYVIMDIFNHVVAGQVIQGVTVAPIAYAVVLGLLLIYRLVTLKIHSNNGGPKEIGMMVGVYLMVWAMAYIIV